MCVNLWSLRRAGAPSPAKRGRVGEGVSIETIRCSLSMNPDPELLPLHKTLSTYVKMQYLWIAQRRANDKETNVKRALLRIGLCVVVMAATLAVPSYGVAQDCPSGTFNCYCNGTWAGCLSSVAFCWNACGQTLQSAKRSKNICSAEVDKNQPAFFCAFEPRAKY
jgi:hypothetical protein